MNEEVEEIHSRVSSAEEEAPLTTSLGLGVSKVVRERFNEELTSLFLFG